MKIGAHIGKMMLILAFFAWFSAPNPAWNEPFQSDQLEELQGQYRSQQQEVDALKTRLQAKEKDYSIKRINYLRIKIASRDWKRRNAAEDEYFTAYDEYQDQRLAFQGATYELEKLLLNIKNLEDQATLTRKLAQAKKAAKAASEEKVTTAQNLFQQALSLLLVCVLPLTLIFWDMLTSILGWCVIKIKKPFKTSDHIEISNFKGEVKTIGLFKTVLVETKKMSQKLIHVPNNLILKKPFSNLSSEVKDELKKAA